MSRGARPGEQGFVLVLTLWILAAIAIAAAYFGERVQASLRLATARQSDNEAQVALSNARAEVLFRIAITPMSRIGLGDPPNYVRLDDRPYQVADSRVQLQDAAGLLDLNRSSDDAMTRFLRTAGVADENRSALIDALRDYADSDDLRRLHGAEVRQYQREGLPRNAPLISPLEVRDVFGWGQQVSLWEGGRLTDALTTDGEPAINPNTASWRVLTAIPMVTPEIAQAIIARREVEPVTAAWLDRVLGTQLDTMMSPVVAFPSSSIRVTQTTQAVPWALRYNVRLTPNGTFAPWVIGYYYRIEKAPADTVAASSDQSANASDPPRFPSRVVLPASSPFALSN